MTDFQNFYKLQEPPFFQKVDHNKYYQTLFKHIPYIESN